MRTLWFKQCYVMAILAGEKTDTIRRPQSRIFRVGETVSLSVGPIRPFAEAQIVACELVEAAAMGDRLAVARALYGDLPAFRRVAFRVTKTFPGAETPIDRKKKKAKAHNTGQLWGD